MSQPSPTQRMPVPEGSLPRHIENPLARLRRAWLVWAVASSVATAGVCSALWATLDATFALRWFGLALPVLAYVLLFARRRLPANHPPGHEMLLASLGPGNHLTMLRGVLIAFLAGFALNPRLSGALAWAPMVLYTLSDVCDYFDGYLARRFHHPTRLGEELDIEFDALGLLIAVLVAVTYSALPAWYLIIGVSRYAYLFGGWIVRLRGRPLGSLPPSVSRRPIAGLTMGFTSAVLWPILPARLTHVAAYIFAVPISFSFIRDWLVVSGAIDSDSSGYTRLRTTAKRWLLHWLPLALRLLTLGAGLALITLQMRNPQSLAAGFPSIGLPASAGLVTGFTVLETLCLLSIGLGAAGRLGAFVLLFPLGLTLAIQSITPTTTVLLVGTLLTLICGTGAFSLAKPEERVLGRRAGESP